MNGGVLRDEGVVLVCRRAVLLGGGPVLLINGAG
jgi:hypothetical protein